MVETAPIAVTLTPAPTAPGGRPLLTASHPFRTLTGYTPQAALGRDLRFMQALPARHPGRARLGEALDAGQAAEAVLHNRRADGSVFAMLMSIAPVPNAFGQPAFFVSAHLDADAVDGAAGLSAHLAAVSRLFADLANACRANGLPAPQSEALGTATPWRFVDARLASFSTASPALDQSVL